MGLLSAMDNSADLTDFAKAVKDKGIAAFGIQEPNRNFERRPMLDDFNHRLRQVSSHYRGQTSSARLGFGSNYQPGGTAVADDGSYLVFQEAERGKRSERSYVQTAQVTVVDNPPSDAVPATLGPISGGRRQVLFRARTAIDEREQAGDPATFAEFVARQPSHISQLLQYSDVSEEGAQRMADVLQSSGSLKCGTDGGALAGEGTFGFVWAAARQFLRMDAVECRVDRTLCLPPERNCV